MLLGSSKWDTNVQSMNNESAAMHLVMHSYEPHMVIADDKRNLRYAFKYEAIRRCIAWI